MVTIEEIQAAYYMVAATGVLVAAVYYIQNLRHAKTAKEIDLALSISNHICTPASLSRYARVMTMSFKTPEEFMEKYGYTHPEPFGDWVSLSLDYEMLGHLLKQKLATSETLYALGSYGCIPMWDKYREVVESRRALAFGKKYLSNFEYLAGELAKVQRRDEPQFEGAWWKRMESPAKP